jgi:LDH2 family malate/lactate/ureidoglycolate dehydrogenase
MLRLDWYIARLKTGAMKAVSELTTLIDLGALAVVDGNDGIGQVVTDRACTSATERAKSHGVGLVAVRNSNHFGTAAYWTRRMANAGVVGILTTNGSPAMAPWGGKEKTVGANPWSIATPGGSHGTVALDIANTNVARGKIYSALQKGQTIPDTWAIGADGKSTIDPLKAIDGILLPVGGHKGYGISFMMDVLSGVLTGSGFATDVIGPYMPEGRSRAGHLVVAIDIESVIGRAEFDNRIDQLIDLTKAVPLADGADEIFYPGEIENRAEARAIVGGVTLPERTVAELRALAADAGVAFPFDGQG